MKHGRLVIRDLARGDDYTIARLDIPTLESIKSRLDNFLLFTQGEHFHDYEIQIQEFVNGDYVTA